MDEDMSCFPSFQTIAECAGCSRRACIDAIQKLVSVWIVKKEARYKENEQISNMYYVTIEEDTPSAGGALGSAGGALGGSAGGAPRTTPTSFNSPNELFIAPTVDEVIEYCKQRQSCVDPVFFHEYYETAWRESNGKKIIRRKQKLITWEKRDKEKKQEGKIEPKEIGTKEHLERYKANIVWQKFSDPFLKWAENTYTPWRYRQYVHLVHWVWRTDAFDVAQKAMWVYVDF